MKIFAYNYRLCSIVPKISLFHSSDFLSNKKSTVLTFVVNVRQKFALFSNECGTSY